MQGTGPGVTSTSAADGSSHSDGAHSTSDASSDTTSGPGLDSTGGTEGTSTGASESGSDGASTGRGESSTGADDCDGDIEIDTSWGDHIGTETCVCKPGDGGPYEPRDPSLCGCFSTASGCECDGIEYSGDTCGCFPSGAECLCDGAPSGLSACGPCGMVDGVCYCDGTEAPDLAFCEIPCDVLPTNGADACLCDTEPIVDQPIGDWWCQCSAADGICKCGGFDAPAYFCGPCEWIDQVCYCDGAETSIPQAECA